MADMLFLRALLPVKLNHSNICGKTVVVCECGLSKSILKNVKQCSLQEK